MFVWAYFAAVAVVFNGEPSPNLIKDSYVSTAAPRQLTATRLSEVDDDFLYQGDYLGDVRAVGGEIVAFGLQVVALGDGKFSSIGYQDGLPGNGWDRETMITWDGARQGKVLTFRGPRGTIIIEAGAGRVIDSSGVEVGHVRKVRRISTTMGVAPPPGAITLFDGHGTEAFQDGKLSPDGWLAAGALTAHAGRRFPDASGISDTLHAVRARPGQRQQWRVHSTALRSADPRFVWSAAGVQWLRGSVSPADSRSEHVFSSFDLADLRYLLHCSAMGRRGAENG